MKNALRITAANFEEEVLCSTLPVLVDFWSSWCPPCKMVEPLIDRLAAETEGRLKVGKLNVDQNPGIRKMYDIKGVPTFIVFRNGAAIGHHTGSLSRGQLLEMIAGAGISCLPAGEEA